ncbi:glycerophosphoryl diester phosphodiesterase membrane domain-containing protein [Brevundimonas sp.]|uniref:glycerophosphoryl diester phosphodiesterase membrane domain-containing protein n=1 Tax=Brevundimonas sp. TaxID=1871086 RepID=UPI001A2F1FEA|nr:glycerophosphoryl diester phosphodiesterase membrane domain-containing protein [Brevundimonas sp.]MBJ7484699.1 glycerophosphoryl diester phosphodiesterase membrane domain-containing protein [Brevundimonas sp.]
MTATDIHGGTFDMGRVVQRTFSAISQNWVVFLVSSVLLIGVPNVISALGQFQALGQLPGTSTSFGSLWVLPVVGGFLAIVGSFVLQGTVVFVTINGLNGRKIDLGEAFSAGLKTFLPLLGLAILMGLGLIIGFILLVVPGIILSVMWIVAAPAVVAEKRGVMESFQRSRDLTRGNRWVIFFLALIYGIATMIITWSILGVGMATAGSFEAGATSPINLLLTPLVNVVSSVISAAGIASIYYELRSIKEGVGAEQIASVFD